MLFNKNQKKIVKKMKNVSKIIISHKKKNNCSKECFFNVKNCLEKILVL